jgi:hypothetical protein
VDGRQVQKSSHSTKLQDANWLRDQSDNEVAVLVRESRADKLIEISTDEFAFAIGIG